MKATPETGMLWRVATARMPTKWGMFHAIGFKREIVSGVPESKRRWRSSWAI